MRRKVIEPPKVHNIVVCATFICTNLNIHLMKQVFEMVTEVINCENYVYPHLRFVCHSHFRPTL